MAWSFQSAGTVATGGSPVVDLPPTYSVGSLLVLVGVSSANFTNPGGWTQVTINQGNNNISIWYKFATASESSVTLSASSSTTKGVMLAYLAISAVNVVGTVNSTTSTTITTNSLTTTVPDALVISVFAIRQGTAQTIIAGTGYTARVTSSGVTTTVSLIVGDENQATAGATTARTATATLSALNDGFSVSFLQTTYGYFFRMF